MSKMSELMVKIQAALNEEKDRVAWWQPELGETLAENVDYMVLRAITDPENNTTVAELATAENWDQFPQLHNLEHAFEYWIEPDDPIPAEELYYFVVMFTNGVVALFNVGYTCPDLSYRVVAII